MVAWSVESDVPAENERIRQTLRRYLADMLQHARPVAGVKRYVHHLETVLVAVAGKVARAVHGYMTGEETKVVGHAEETRSWLTLSGRVWNRLSQQ